MAARAGARRYGHRMRPSHAVVDLLARTYRAWRRDRVMRLGAALAYYALFALVPMLVLMIGVAGIVVSRSDVQAAVTTAVADTLDVDEAAVTTALADAVPDAGAASSLGVVGVGALLISASLLFVALQDALDVIWHVPVETGFHGTVRRRAVAFAVILLGAGLLVAASALQSVFSLFDALLPTDRRLVGVLTSTLTTALTWALVVSVVAVLLRLLPRSSVTWRAALVGGVVVTVVLAAGTALFGLYMRTVAVRSAGGAASGVLAVLLYSYFANQVLLAGAVLTRQIDRTDAADRRPSSDPHPGAGGGAAGGQRPT